MSDESQSYARPESFAVLHHTLLPSDNDRPLLTQVKKYSVYNFFGSFNQKKIAQSAGVFVASNSDGDSEALVATFQHFLNLAEADCLNDTSSANKLRANEACALTIRMGPPTDNWVKPRWHQDGRMYSCTCAGGPDQNPHSTFSVTLLGPPTLVLKPSEFISNVVARSDMDEDQSRDKLAREFATYERFNIQTGDIYRFSWGQEDSPVHSEPDSSNSDRVLVMLKFGSEEEIRDQCQNWDTNYDHCPPSPTGH